MDDISECYQEEIYQLKTEIDRLKEELKIARRFADKALEWSEEKITDDNLLDESISYEESIAKLDKGSNLKPLGVEVSTSAPEQAKRNATVQSKATPHFQQLDAVNNRVELEKDNWRLRFKCCDCGLIHMMSFAIEKNGNLGIAIDRETQPDECPKGGDCKGTGKVEMYDDNFIDTKIVPCPKCSEGEGG